MSRCSGSSARPAERGEWLRAQKDLISGAREPQVFLFRPGPARTAHRWRHAIACYENSADGDEILLHAAIPVNVDPSGDPDFAIVDLPESEQAATIVHHGSMDTVMPTIQSLAHRIGANAYRSAVYNRGLYIECAKNRDAWVTEFQEPITTS